ncbi:MAG TPA: enoyl-CoA hydratase-related protein [Polyangiaceae bacterium]
MSTTLLVEEEGALAVVTLNRPDKLNALDSALLAAVGSAVSNLAARPAATRPRSVIITGAGDKAFAAGADIAEFSGLSAEQARALSQNGQHVARVLEEAPFPVIAAVNGFALGGGCELALACDFVYASDRARFGQPEVGLGLIPGFGGTQRLARRVGIGRARELVYSGAVIGAEQAKAIGLVNEVVPHAELIGRVKELCRAIASKAPLAVAAAKRVMLRGAGVDLTAGCELETEAFGALFATNDAREGTQAFLAKRPPSYQGS